jgi:hypothetical protein
MVIPEWLLSNAVLVALIAVAMWVARSYLSSLIVESVRADFATSLENLRAELRTKEENLRAELRAREVDILALREGALAHVRSSQEAMFGRRLQAVDDLWGGVSEWGQYSGLLMFMTLLRSDEMIDAIKKGETGALAMAEGIKQSAAKETARIGDKANSARPFVSDLAWALYTALASIYGLAAAQAKLLNPRKMNVSALSTSSLDDLLIAAMPDMKDYIEKSGAIGHWHLTETLRGRLLTELRSSLGGGQQDVQSVARAAEILRASEAVQTERAKAEQAAGTGAS